MSEITQITNLTNDLQPVSLVCLYNLKGLFWVFKGEERSKAYEWMMNGTNDVVLARGYVVWTDNPNLPAGMLFDSPFKEANSYMNRFEFLRDVKFTGGKVKENGQA